MKKQFGFMLIEATLWAAALMGIGLVFASVAQKV